jgi:AcrR family transcriptional regulator
VPGLPLIDAEPPERADAARNRRAVLDAAARLFARDGVACVTMEAVAAEAGVGKGTVFRRFGDRASLARAVISEHETELQEAMIRGEPPLGPGAPARERLIAFGRAYLEFLESHADLLLAAEATQTLRLARREYPL